MIMLFPLSSRKEEHGFLDSTFEYERNTLPVGDVQSVDRSEVRVFQSDSRVEGSNYHRKNFPTEL